MPDDIGQHGRSTPCGGDFLVRQIGPEDIFTPEQLPAEARLIAKTMEDFLRKEVLPIVPRLETHEPGLMPSLLRKAGSLGLLAGGIPACFGGLELSRIALTLLAERAAPYLSFAISMGVHVGVATLPLLFFGAEEQKAKYLPQLASGEAIGAFALSEANSGSDALGARTRATLSPDGSHYLLTGEKLWTTNGGFADLFTVFAKVDGERFTAFLVEKETPGLVLGREEQKMGLHGSSTRRILLQEAQVPISNVLGEVGKGHRPALYALNIGRFNIGVTALGAAKECLRLAARYAKERIQFGQPIAAFGLIRHKLSAMATRIYVLESMIYRLAGYWDALADEPQNPNHQAPITKPPLLYASEEYAIECAIIKFFGTEVLDYVVDEALQIHGGFGYSAEFPIERMYRDARVFRIFEGTNEINRLTVLDQLLRRLAGGRLDFWEDDGSRPTMPAGIENPEGRQETVAASILNEVGEGVSLIRNVTRVVLQADLGRQEGQFHENQIFAAASADLAATVFALESAWLRAAQPRSANDLSAAAQAYAAEATDRVEQLARAALASLQTEAATSLASRVLDGLHGSRSRNAVAPQQRIADLVLAQEGYPW